MKRIIEMSDGKFRVQYKMLWWWFFCVTGNGDVEWPLCFDTESDAIKYVNGNITEIKRVVIVFN